MSVSILLYVQGFGFLWKLSLSADRVLSSLIVSVKQNLYEKRNGNTDSKLQNAKQ